MIRGVLTLLALVSTVLFPWFFTVVFAFGLAFIEPLVPLAVGIFADTLYYVPTSGTFPTATLWGASATLIASVVHSRLRPSSMRG